MNISFNFVYSSKQSTKSEMQGVYIYEIDDLINQNIVKMPRLILIPIPKILKECGLVPAFKFIPIPFSENPWLIIS